MSPHGKDHRRRLEPLSVHENLFGGPPPTRLPDDPPPRRPASPTTPRPATSSRAGPRPRTSPPKCPTSSLAWAQPADDAFERGSVVESYAYARTGYHRGLDVLRRSGWMGHGPVPGRMALHVIVRFPHSVPPLPE
ncbi:DUF3151 family protein [Streptomyces guryensis]|uniref:DUF3151 family protein n=1 Tax=Streptomyces guryensis TaxID=2886947 RepID=UPI0022B792D8|nr:DUF3151 family protein [Streptomyces guryensis]